MVNGLSLAKESVRGVGLLRSADEVSVADSPARTREQRRFSRSQVDLPVEFTTRDSWDTMAGVAKDLSVGGMFIETTHAVSVGMELVVRIAFPGHGERAAVPATVRWTSADGMGVQFGLLGARVTHAITEIARANTVPRPP
jgi:type IV pilus assembly protein PilZ